MKTTVLIPLLLGAMILPSCKKGDIVVENPLIEYSNTRTISIPRVELNDTATIVTVDAKFTPHYWIKFVSETTLESDGKSYALIGADGCTPDSLFWMPDSGEASFKFYFEPLPKSAKKFDFIEGNDSRAFRLKGINLKNNESCFADYPEGLPDEFRKTSTDGPLPQPVLAQGETTLNVHFLGGYNEPGEEISLYLIDPLKGEVQTKVITLDEDGKGSLTVKLLSTTQAFVIFNEGLGFDRLWFAPGETVDMYIDGRRLGAANMALFRDESISDYTPNGFVWVNGKYGDLVRLKSTNLLPDDGITAMPESEKRFYRMSGEEYADLVMDNYRNMIDSVIPAAELPQMMKELAKANALQTALDMIVSHEIHAYRSYYEAHGYDTDGVPEDSVKLSIQPEILNSLLGELEITPQNILMGYENSTISCSMPGIVTIMESAGKEVNDTLRGISDYYKFYGVADTGTLNDEVIDSIANNGIPYFGEVLRSVRDEVRAIVSTNGNGKIMPVPDVDDSKLFETIIKPYRGKTVMVDFWNTWCGPCRSAIRENEPYKSTELASDDLVFVYIANETSPLSTYNEMIQEIDGIHYRLDEQSWDYLTDKFGVDGIPSYVLVDKDGNASLRNDFRDHSLYLKTLKEAIGK